MIWSMQCFQMPLWSFIHVTSIYFGILTISVLWSPDHSKSGQASSFTGCWWPGVPASQVCLLPERYRQDVSLFITGEDHPVPGVQSLTHTDMYIFNYFNFVFVKSSYIRFFVMSRYQNSNKLLLLLRRRNLPVVPFGVFSCWRVTMEWLKIQTDPEFLFKQVWSMSKAEVNIFFEFVSLKKNALTTWIIQLVNAASKSEL